MIQSWFVVSCATGPETLTEAIDAVPGLASSPRFWHNNNTADSFSHSLACVFIPSRWLFFLCTSV